MTVQENPEVASDALHRTGSSSISLLKGLFEGAAKPLYEHDESLNDSGTSLNLSRGYDSDDEEEEVTGLTRFLTNCTLRLCILKTTLTLVACAIIVGLAFMLEPGYAEISMYTPKSHGLCMRLLTESLPEETLERIEEKYTPQAMALEWMDNDPKLNSYPLWRHRKFYSFPRECIAISV